MRDRKHLFCVVLPWEDCPHLVEDSQVPEAVSLNNDGTWTYADQTLEIGRGVRADVDGHVLLPGPVFVGDQDNPAHLVKKEQVIAEYARHGQLVIA